MTVKPPLNEGFIFVVGCLFYKAASQYAILKCVNHRKPKDQQVEFVSKGKFFSMPKKGDVYKVRGRMERDEDRKEDYFNVIWSELKLEEQTTQGMIEYLRREGPNVGDIRARELVDNFGSSVLMVLANEPQKVMERKGNGCFDGLTQERLDQLSIWARDQLRVADAKQKLYSLNVGPATVSKIIVFFGTKIIEVLANDPFRLMQIDGIAFLTADKIASANGCKPDNPGRIKNGILFTMQECEKDGHSCMTYEDLIEKSQKLLGVSKTAVTEQCALLLESEELCTSAVQPQKYSRLPHLFDIVE